jgi:hypothetical protein
MNKVLNLFLENDLDTLKNKYRVGATDQPIG